MASLIYSCYTFSKNRHVFSTSVSVALKHSKATKETCGLFNIFTFFLEIMELPISVSCFAYYVCKGNVVLYAMGDHWIWRMHIIIGIRQNETQLYYNFFQSLLSVWIKIAYNYVSRNIYFVIFYASSSNVLKKFYRKQQVKPFSLYLRRIVC